MQFKKQRRNENWKVTAILSTFNIIWFFYVWRKAGRSYHKYNVSRGSQVVDCWFTDNFHVIIYRCSAVIILLCICLFCLELRCKWQPAFSVAVIWHAFMSIFLCTVLSSFLSFISSNCIMGFPSLLSYVSVNIAAVFFAAWLGDKRQFVF